MNQTHPCRLMICSQFSRADIDLIRESDRIKRVATAILALILGVLGGVAYERSKAPKDLNPQPASAREVR